MKLNGALAGALLSFLARAEATRVRGGKASAMDISSVGDLLEPMEPRQLQTGDFVPLACNAALADAVCTPLPADFAGVVPCGVCYSMSDFGGARAGETLTMASGLNVIGRLDFPDGSKVTIETPSVFVQGILSMSSTRAVTGEPDISIRMTGDTDIIFTPEGENAGACSGGACNVGPKAFVVAGGQLDINAMPDSCPTWSHILSVGHAAQPVPADFPSPPDPPTSSSGALCSASVVNEDFEGGLNQWYGNLGAYESIQEGSHDGSRYLSITERSFYHPGPLFDIPESVRECTLPDTAYFFKTKIRLSSSSTPSLCSTAGTNCPALQFGRMASDDKVYWYKKAGVDPTIYPGDNEWFDFSGVVEFSSQELSTDDVFQMLTVNGPEAGVDIAIDDFSISLPEGTAYPDPNNVCGNLIVNGDAELFGGFPFPHTSYVSTSQLYTKTDGNNNNYFHAPSRKYFWDGLSYDLLPSCLTPSSIYTFSAKVRVNSDVPVVVKPTIRYLDPNGIEQFDTITTCPASTADGGFVTCTADFTFGENYITSPFAKMFFYGVDDQTSAIDYDDISFVHKSGSPTGLVLDSAITSSCWGPGATVFLPSGSPEGGVYDTATVSSVQGAGIVGFVESLVNGVGPITSEKDSPDFAREVAVLSRNIVFESDPLSSIGGTLTVLRTPRVKQTIQGVEINGFGQEGVLGRNPILFKMNGDLSGSAVSKNTITQSKNRCVNIHATDGLRVSDNVALLTVGHCYALEDGGETGNIFTRNLGAITVAATSKAAGETDDRPATFYANNPSNSWVDNVAAGSERLGFQFQGFGKVSGESASLFTDMRPNIMPIILFSGNAMHSNIVGFQATNMRPTSNQYINGLKTFRNWRNGFLGHTRNMVLSDGVTADSRLGIEFYLSENMFLEDFKVSGYTDTYRALATSIEGYPQFCYGSTSPPIYGIKLHANVLTDGQPGNTFTNVAFTDFGQDCGPSSSAVTYNDHFTTPGFTAPTVFSGLTFDTVSANKIDLCSLAATGIKSVSIDDTDGALDPNNGAGPGMVRSDDVSMDLGNCVTVPNTCSLYCTDAAPGEPTEPAPAPAPTPVVIEPAPSPTPPASNGAILSSIDPSLSSVDLPSDGICLQDSTWESFKSELETVPGRSTGLAYKAYSRTHQARGGPIMSFDTSCLVANEWYEIRADVLAQNAGTEEINNCSADDPWQSVRSCPAISIRAGSYYKLIAPTVGPYNNGGVGWNEIYGVFQATSEIMEQSTVYLHVARAAPSVDITIGDAVITAASPTAAGKTDCSASNLIFNGGAETRDSRSWNIRGNLDNLGYIDIVEPGYEGSYAFKHSGYRTVTKTSMVQFLDMSCFTSGSSWRITANFIFFQADESGNETPVSCEKDSSQTQSVLCPGFEFLGDGDEATSTGYLDNFDTGAINVGGWNSYSASFTVSDAMAATSSLWVVVAGVAPGYSYYLDNVALSPF
mmetsp:Transcript_33905/g.49625  ORF Transcript_33905/g.49625 Transcript_33905/m.49625 type:complete len:1459 (-) Transcript_33905:164-4540(-)